jgi:aminoglycoside 2'-N-acetyltransferase I
MTKLVLAHTGQLAPAELAAAHQLLEEVFAPELTEQDWEHCLGGMHALVWEGAELVGHAALIQRRLLHNGRALRTGYFEGVGVRATARRRGHGAAMMAALEQLARNAYELGALGATDEAVPFYTGRGWRRWQGQTWALTPAGVLRTEEEDDGIYVLPMSGELDLHGALTCDWRDGESW